MNKSRKTIYILLSAIVAISGAYLLCFKKATTEQNINTPVKVPVINTPQQKESPASSENDVSPAFPEIEAERALFPPLSSASERVTKKPFGIKVSPGSSPVSPERFSGYHTGVDFEIFQGEENLDIYVSAICSGPILVKRIVSGYGGAVVQKCSIENIAVTVIYGHLKLSNIERSVGDEMPAGENIGMLGREYSAETAGERKHLHLGIHKGNEINYLGYVQREKDLSGWINAMEYLR